LSVACDIKGLTEHQPVAGEEETRCLGEEPGVSGGRGWQRGTSWLGWRLSVRAQLKGME